MLADDDGEIRASALAALERRGEVSIADLRSGIADASPHVRRRALSALVPRWSEALADGVDLAAALQDADPMVLEHACFVAGECQPPGPGVVSALIAICTGHDDPLCRESAAAALGSLGDPAGRDAVLAACTDRATVRRRAALALVAFDGPEVDAMAEALTSDPDWQVRQAAEDLLTPG